MQTLIPSFRRIPRAIFTVLAFIIYTVAGVAGRQHFSAILSNFLAVVCFQLRTLRIPIVDTWHEKLGYWLAFWSVILMEEHFIFRRTSGPFGGYNLHAYDSPEL